MVKKSYGKGEVMIRFRLIEIERWKRKASDSLAGIGCRTLEVSAGEKGELAGLGVGQDVLRGERVD